MHEQMKRLYEAAGSLKGIIGQSKLARALNVSPQTVKNWESRGVSREGTLAAQRIIGCSAVWVETGEGPMQADNMPEDASLRELVRTLQGLRGKQVELVDVVARLLEGFAVPATPSVIPIAAHFKQPSYDADTAAVIQVMQALEPGQRKAARVMLQTYSQNMGADGFLGAQAQRQNLSVRGRENAAA